MSEMVERVARALCESNGSDPDALHFQIPDDEYQEPAWKAYVFEARAAIEAMREPDDEMVEAACQATFIPVSLTGEQTHRLGYRAMLDAALALPIPGEENTEGEKR